VTLRVTYLETLGPGGQSDRSAVLASTRAVAGIAPEEFDVIVPTHQRRIYRLLLGCTRDPDAADTLTQECFLRAYQKRASYRGEASIGTWLARIAVNLAMDHGRSPRSGFWRRLLGGADSANPRAEIAARADAHASPLRELEAREEVAAMWSIVAELPALQRMVFTLRFVEDMTLEEIAQAAQLQLGTVKSHLFRALAKVRAALKQRGQK
jgi:RNA polymerase sigma-70 factor, ECF subfamily